MTIATRNRWAMADVAGGIRLWRLAWALGWLDIRLRYRGSMLGPFWLTISTGVMIAALGGLYSTLFKLDLREYLPFLALSQVLWGFLAAIVSEACSVFTEAEGVIRSMRMPFFVFSLRTLIRNVIALGHNIVVIVVVFVIFGMWPDLNSLMALPGLLLWAVDALALTLVLGAFCARFRDIQPIVNSVMQIAFFVTPVIWKPTQLGPQQHRQPGIQPVLRPAGDRPRAYPGHRSDQHDLDWGAGLQRDRVGGVLVLLRPHARPCDVLGVIHGR